MARRNHAAPIALGGIFAALALTVMCFGGMIPGATFICPMVCMGLLVLVLQNCDNRIGWAWYGAVAILSILIGPDKEAAAVFVFIGYYPILKPKMDKLPLKWLWKLLFFNVAILVMYFVLLNLFGMAELAKDFEEMGRIFAVVLLIIGNITFFMLDKLLAVKFIRRK